MSTPAALVEVSTPSARAGRGRLFRIPDGKCIVTSVQGRTFNYKKGPSTIREDEIDPKKVASYIQSGFLVILGDPNVDDISISSRVVTHDSVRAPGSNTPLTPAEIAGVQPAKRLKRASMFNFDPETLKGKSLDELNLMLIGISPASQPLETTEALIAKLSEHYGG